MYVRNGRYLILVEISTLALYLLVYACTIGVCGDFSIGVCTEACILFSYLLQRTIISSDVLASCSRYLFLFPIYCI